MTAAAATGSRQGALEAQGVAPGACRAEVLQGSVIDVSLKKEMARVGAQEATDVLGAPTSSTPHEATMTITANLRSRI